jgi:sulfide:quinone oxidoreductase
VAHFEGEVLVHNIGRFLAGRPLDASFDGHTNCFVETGFHKALLIDFNYETEPLPGHYPASVGLPLLKESRANHFGKLAFEWLYWHGLLPGRDVPGIASAMPQHGKQSLPV